MASDKMGVTDETVATVLKKNTPPFPCYTMEVYNEILIFIPVDIMEDVFKSVTQKLLGSLSPIGTDSEALQGWVFKIQR